MGKKIHISLDFDQQIEPFLRSEFSKLIDYRILSQSLDARRANQGRTPRYNYHLEVIEQGESFAELKENFVKLSPKEWPIIVGAGPAGLFCALRLIEYGIPSIIVERGDTASRRMQAIARFWRYGECDPDNNVCFGEGGAGLFSDGKLITRIKSPYVSYVMKKLVELGAPKEIAYLSNPHLGSNRIRLLIEKIGQFLRERGCIFHYNSPVRRLLLEKGQIQGVVLSNGQCLHSSNVILATGHSAQDVYQFLHADGVQIRPKDFAIGVRIEHPRCYIDWLQYGKFAGKLETAKYRLSYHDQTTDRGVYSFCMCPGGYVISSGTEADGLVANGMSNFRRMGPWSNSALVVSVKAGVDFALKGEYLDGIYLQRRIEKDAYQLSKEYASGRELPASNLENYLEGNNKRAVKRSSSPSGFFNTNLEKLFPSYINEHLKRAIEQFNRHLKGFIYKDAQLLAPETRTSSAVTIVRQSDSLQAPGIEGLYPCGEGAGYSGGITSSAVDGVKVAEVLLQKEFNLEYKTD